jgi:hypothetical protein
MRLFHGSNEEVKFPNSDLGRNKLDFGKGFYVTTSPVQAEEWAVRVAKYRAKKDGIPTPIVSVYDYQEDNNLIEKRFIGYDEEWLFFVSDNRRSDYPIINHGYDIIYGHIADDRVIETIDIFIEQLQNGEASKNLIRLTIEQLQKQQPNDQYCFTNSKLCEVLQFSESYKVIDNA